ncbi:unnamed protein product [Closterium sp. NIES-54]
MSWAQGGGGGGGGGGGVGGAPPPTSTIYVANLPPGADEELLAEHFGTIGLIKRDKRTGRAKVWLYRDKESMALKGDATVTYEDPFAAAAAVDWFHNKDFHGRTIAVSLAQTKHGSAGGAGGGGAGGGAGGGNGYPGDVSGRGEEGGGGGEMRGAVGAGGGGGGDGGAVAAAAQGKPWQQSGDWMCPNATYTGLGMLWNAWGKYTRGMHGKGVGGMDGKKAGGVFRWMLGWSFNSAGFAVRSPYSYSRSLFRQHFQPRHHQLHPPSNSTHFFPPLIRPSAPLSLSSLHSFPPPPSPHPFNPSSLPLLIPSSPPSPPFPDAAM